MALANGRLELHEINFIGLVLSRSRSEEDVCAGVTLLSQKPCPCNRALTGFLRMKPRPHVGVTEMPQPQYENF
jgi:hypothetical protein